MSVVSCFEPARAKKKKRSRAEKKKPNPLYRGARDGGPPELGPLSPQGKEKGGVLLRAWGKKRGERKKRNSYVLWWTTERRESRRRLKREKERETPACAWGEAGVHLPREVREGGVTAGEEKIPPHLRPKWRRPPGKRARFYARPLEKKKK